MPASAVVTAKTGPDRQNTALPIPNVIGINFDFKTMRVTITTDQIAGNHIKEYELTTTSTIAVVNTLGNFVVTIA